MNLILTKAQAEAIHAEMRAPGLQHRSFGWFDMTLPDGEEVMECRSGEVLIASRQGRNEEYPSRAAYAAAYGITA